jgi:hypothetical protein
LQSYFCMLQLWGNATELIALPQKLRIRTPAS